MTACRIHCGRNRHPGILHETYLAVETFLNSMWRKKSATSQTRSDEVGSDSSVHSACTLRMRRWATGLAAVVNNPSICLKMSHYPSKAPYQQGVSILYRLAD